MSEKKQHAAIPYLQDQLQKGKLSRREFMRYATLLGMSVGAATIAAQCAAPAAPPAAPPAE
jgi:peptide/nickel transport system substrate-binding protein